MPMSLPRVACLMVTALPLVGCCTTGQLGSRGPLPPPITVDEQVRRLQEWSQALPRIKATTVIAGVRLDYRDDKGQDRTVNAEGILQIRQHLDSAAAVPADVLLLGKSFDRPAFEAGRNARNWWFAVKLDTKKAWIGDATIPLNLDAQGGGSGSILRADLVPDLLGLSALPGATQVVSPAASATSQLFMLVNDADGANHLLVTREADHELIRGSTAPGQIWNVHSGFVTREILVDRRTNRISEVRLYNPAGILAVRSQLFDYQAVTVDAAGAGDLKPPYAQFPRKVVVSYPAQFLTVSLQFDTVTIPADFKPAVFTMPDFQAQGLLIMPTD